MIPIILALGFSVSDFFYTIWVKKLLDKKYKPFDIIRFWMVFTGLISLIALFFVGIHIHSNLFYLGLIGFTFSTILGHYFQVKALDNLPLSIVSPLGAFFPVLMVIVAVFTLGEIPSLLGFLGVLIVVAGSYTLTLKSMDNFFEPLIFLFKNKKVWFKHFANISWVIAAVFLKIALTNVEIFSGMFILSAVVGFVALASFWLYAPQENLFRCKSLLYGMGFIRLFQNIFQWILYTVVFLGYASAFTNISLIFLVIAGKFYFKEKQGWERIISALVMYAGIQLILLYG